MPRVDKESGRRAKVKCDADQGWCHNLKVAMRSTVAQTLALGLEERHWNTNFNRSGETDRVERCDGGIPTCQGFHREAVKRLSLMEFMANCIGGAEDVERVVQLSCGEETTGLCEQHQDFLPSQPGESLLKSLFLV